MRRRLAARHGAWIFCWMYSPQADEFEIPKYSPVWAYAKPAEFDEIGDQLDEIAWSSLISCIIGSEDQFDANYDEMLAELEGVGMADAEAMLTEIVKESIAGRVIFKAAGNRNGFLLFTPLAQ